MTVVGMQNAFVGVGPPIEIPPVRAMVPRLNRPLDGCRAHNIRVIYIHRMLRGGNTDARRRSDHHEAVWNNQALMAGTKNAEIHEG